MHTLTLCWDFFIIDKPFWLVKHQIYYQPQEIIIVYLNHPSHIISHRSLKLTNICWSLNIKLTLLSRWACWLALRIPVYPVVGNEITRNRLSCFIGIWTSCMLEIASDMLVLITIKMPGESSDWVWMQCYENVIKLIQDLPKPYSKKMFKKGIIDQSTGSYMEDISARKSIQKQFVKKRKKTTNGCEIL